MPKKHQPGDGQTVYEIIVAVDLNGDWIRGVPPIPDEHRKAVAEALRSALKDVEGSH
jgi:uncharacterized protein (DUF2342 family)